MSKKVTHLRLHAQHCSDRSNYQDIFPGDYAVADWQETYPALAEYLLANKLADPINASAVRTKKEPANLWQEFAQIATTEQGDEFESEMRWVASRDGRFKMGIPEFKHRLQGMPSGTLPLDIIVMFKDNQWFEYDPDPDDPKRGYWTPRHTPYEPTQKAKDWEW